MSRRISNRSADFLGPLVGYPIIGLNPSLAPILQKLRALPRGGSGFSDRGVSVYYVARGLPERDLKLMRILDDLHLKWPFYGARKLTREQQATRSAAGM